MPRKATPGVLAPVGPRLRALVESDGRTIGEVAEAAGLSPNYLSQLLTGHRPNPTTGTTGRILDALGRSWGDLDG